MSVRRQLISAAMGGVCIGVGVGYILANKRLAAEFEERLARETSEMKEWYETVELEPKKYATPEEAVADLVIPEVVKNGQVVAYHKIAKEYNPSDDDPEEEYAIESEIGEPLIDIPVIEKNVFDNAERGRDTSRPYLISQEEFMQNDPEFEQITLTWHETDDVLADVRGDVIDDRARVVGTDFMASFGYQSSDPNVVHIRNEKLALDFEVVKSELPFDDDPIETPKDRLRREG